MYGLNGETGMWMFDDRDNSFWLGQLADHQSYVEETSWFDEYGDENYAGGYWRTSKRYMELTLKGPFNAGDLRISVKNTAHEVIPSIIGPPHLSLI